MHQSHLPQFTPLHQPRVAGAKVQEVGQYFPTKLKMMLSDPEKIAYNHMAGEPRIFWP